MRLISFEEQGQGKIGVLTSKDAREFVDLSLANPNLPRDMVGLLAMAGGLQAARNAADAAPVLLRGHGHRDQRAVPDAPGRGPGRRQPHRAFRLKGVAEMIVTKMALPRRTFLRGVGVTLALPLLDSMVPAQTPIARTAAKPMSRLGFVYVPHGMIMDKFTPASTGRGWEFTPILKPLEAYRDQISIVSGLGHKAADSTAVHSLSPTTWLSGVPALANHSCLAAARPKTTRSSSELEPRRLAP